MNTHRHENARTSAQTHSHACMCMRFVRVCLRDARICACVNVYECVRLCVRVCARACVLLCAYACFCVCVLFVCLFVCLLACLLACLLVCVCSAFGAPEAPRARLEYIYLPDPWSFKRPKRKINKTHNNTQTNKKRTSSSARQVLKALSGHCHPPP